MVRFEKYELHMTVAYLHTCNIDSTTSLLSSISLLPSDKYNHHLSNLAYNSYNLARNKDLCPIWITVSPQVTRDPLLHVGQHSLSNSFHPHPSGQDQHPSPPAALSFPLALPLLRDEQLYGR